MEEIIETKALPSKVWETWEKAQAANGHVEIKSGVQGRSGKKGFPYKILNVKQGECFSILWKTLFVRLVFTHQVKPTSFGSQIRYGVQIKGLFAWPVRWFLGEKIRKNLSLVLKATVHQLENDCKGQSCNG